MTECPVMNNLKQAIPFTLILFAAMSHAASFDCSKASTPVEKTICADAELSKLDDLLAQSYKNALAIQPDSAELKTHQRNWLKNVRNQCQDVACLKEAYLERLAGLKAFAENSANVTAPVEQQAPVSPPSVKKNEPDPLIAKYSKSFGISQSLLAAPVLGIPSDIEVPLVKFIDSAFRHEKSKPSIKAEGNKVIVRLNTRDELTDEKSRTDLLITGQEVDGKLWAIIVRVVITDEDGASELMQNEIIQWLTITWFAWVQ